MACTPNFKRIGAGHFSRQPSREPAGRSRYGLAESWKRKGSKLFVQVPQASRLRAVAGREWKISICLLS